MYFYLPNLYYIHSNIILHFKWLNVSYHRNVTTEVCNPLPLVLVGDGHMHTKQ